MKRSVIWNLLVIALVLALAAGCSKMPSNAEAGEDGSSGQSNSLLPSKALAVNVPAGTPITIRLQNAVSSATAHPGDSFDAVVDEPIVVDGQTVAPRGAQVTGRVVAAKSSGRLQDPGYLRLTLTTITVSGKAVPVQTSSIFVKGGSHNKRNLELIGGGAAGGALIGALAGGGKGALIGSAIGAGAGTGTAYATGKKDVGFGAERRLTFRLTQPLPTRS